MEKHKLACKYCGKDFYVTKYYSKKRKYCSRLCSLKVNAVKNLGEWTDPKKIAERNKEEWFRRRVSSGLKKHYKENPIINEQWYLERYGKNYVPKKAKHSALWKTQSTKLRGKYDCQRCGSDKNLDVHHIIPFSVSKNNNIENLVVLCRSCHKRTEDNNIKIFNIVKDWDIVKLLYKTSFEDVGRGFEYRVA